jgi:hypothetical protein
MAPFFVTCVKLDQTEEQTQERWLSAKCPPTEICGPQSDPESLVIAWLDASQNDLCRVLTKYTSPERSEIVPKYCGAVENYTIEVISVIEPAAVNQSEAILKRVDIHGRLDFTLDGDEQTRRNWSFVVEEIGGKWFVNDVFH